MFYDEFIKLCNSVQKSPTAVAKEIGLAGAHVTKWKNGSKPTDATIYKVCDYFGIPYDYFSETESTRNVFYDLFVELCQKNKVAPTRAALDMGLSKSAPIKWRTTKATPQGETLNKIAVYFGVSVDSLLGKEDNKKTPPAKARGMNDDELKFALFGSADIDDDDFDDVKRYAQFIAQRKKEKEKK